MKQYDSILFDLDGTLTDPGLGITNSVSHALRKFGRPVPPRAQLYKFIGPPLAESFEVFCGFSKEEAQTAVEYYREYFRDRGIFENRVYEGIEEMLRDLLKSGKTLMVATSKPEAFAKQILEHFGLAHYFSLIAGAFMDGARTKKDEVIAYALESARGRALMVGDREHDVLGANKNGLDSLGVLFGYGSREELEAAGATYLAETVGDIAKIVLAGGE